MSPADYTEVTETPGFPATKEQIERLARRYYWASEYCCDEDVLEVACGSALGLGYVGSRARSLLAGDYSASLLKLAHQHYGQRFTLLQFDAQAIPFASASFGVVMLFEALYYIPDVETFFREARRVLRPGGTLLVATANKDLYDFNRSPHSVRYLGVVELTRELSALGFEVTCFGDTRVDEVSTRQRLLRPVKALAARFNLIPGTMHAKTLLKRLVFGPLRPIPSEVTHDTGPYLEPHPLEPVIADRRHKVIFCAAKLGPGAMNEDG